METVGFIIGNSLDGLVLSGDLVLERYHIFACLQANRNRGASSPRKSDHLAVQPAAPWCPTSPQRAGEGSHCHQPLQVRALSLSHIHILFCTARMKQQGLPHTDQEFLLSWPPAGHSWSEMSHSMEQGDRLKPYMPIWMEAQVALPIRHLLMLFAVTEANRCNAQRTMWRNSTSRAATPENSGMQVLPRLNK